MGPGKRHDQDFSGGKKPTPLNASPPAGPEWTVLGHQAAELLQQGNLRAAETIYRQLISAGHGQACFYVNLAAICGMTGRIQDAPALLQAALAIEPNLPDAHNNLGLTWMEQGDLKAAIHAFEQVIQLNPDHGQAHYNLGIALQKLGDLNGAIGHYDHAIRLNPNEAGAHYNLAIALQAQGKLQAAVASYSAALQLRPAYPEALINLGTALVKLENLAGAEHTFQQALLHHPESPEAHLNLSMLRLLQGDYQNGLPGYEWRSRKQNNPSQPHASPKTRQWDGSTLKSGDKLLVVSEQGIGDTLQFMRYIIPLQKRGVNVSLVAPEKLHGIIQASGIHSHPITSAEAENVSDGPWIPMLSLPRHLQVSPNNPVLNEPYIKTNPERILHWRQLLSSDPRPIVGLNWQGNPQAEQNELQGRSLPLETFAPLANCANATLLSLQKGFGAEQLEGCSFRHRFVGCQENINSSWEFLETAAIVANCDLIITSDTALAHLAGGMGKTTWLLLTKVPEWRWGMEGETTFWYPSMRLFRQRQRGHWEEVMDRVAEALQTYQQKDQSQEAAQWPNVADKMSKIL